MKKRYAVVAGVAMATPFGSALAQAQDSDADVPTASWATMDADGDGSLSMKEVSGTPWAAKFAAMDANDDQAVSRQEYHEYMKQSRGKHKGDSPMNGSASGTDM